MTVASPLEDPAARVSGSRTMTDFLARSTTDTSPAGHRWTVVTTTTTFTATSAPPATLTPTTHTIAPIAPIAPTSTAPPVEARKALPPTATTAAAPVPTTTRLRVAATAVPTTAPQPEPEPEVPAPCSTTAATPAATDSPTGVSFDTDAEARFLQLTNEARAKVGVEPLTINTTLQVYARNHALTMVAADRGLFHSNITNLFAYTTCLHIGENVGLGPSVDSIQSALLASPGHYENLANGVYQVVGVAVAVDSTGRIWTAHVFAS